MPRRGSRGRGAGSARTPCTRSSIAWLLCNRGSRPRARRARRRATSWRERRSTTSSGSWSPTATACSGDILLFCLLEEPSKKKGDCSRRQESRMSPMRSFAYGSNLDPADLDRWCASRGVPRVTLDRPVRGFLPDRRLAFSHRSTTRGGGVLDVVDAPGHAVEGIMFAVSDRALEILDRKESSGHVYRRVPRTI